MCRENKFPDRKNKIMIRKITKNELPALFEIFKDNIKNPWSFEGLCDFFEDETHVFLGCFKGNVLAGYAIYSTIIDEGEILSIATSKGFKRQGIATLLLNEIFDSTKKAGVCRLLLEVRMENNIARTFYEKNNFKTIGTRADYYHNSRLRRKFN